MARGRRTRGEVTRAVGFIRALVSHHKDFGFFPSRMGSQRTEGVGSDTVSVAFRKVLSGRFVKLDGEGSNDGCRDTQSGGQSDGPVVT